ncbi:MAG TPA: hypothetical protein PKC98_24460 [Candidatus Melainabacteria bacterium]|nr:hypothetical protein [Candidatus Melainabacteria bacterium]
MVFQEQKTADGFKYFTEDFIGQFTFKCKSKLNANILDTCVLKLTNSPTSKGTIKDSRSGNEIEYDFIKRNLWEDDGKVEDK